MASASDVGSGALAGGATGATIGSYAGPYGALIGGAIGAVGGGLTGWFAGNKREDAENAQRNAVSEARKQLQELAKRQRAQREADLQRALAYFGPVQQEIGRLYGTGTPPSAAAPTSMAPAAGSFGGPLPTAVANPNPNAGFFAAPTGRGRG